MVGITLQHTRVWYQIWNVAGKRRIVNLCAKTLKGLCVKENVRPAMALD